MRKINCNNGWCLQRGHKKGENNYKGLVQLWVAIKHNGLGQGAIYLIHITPYTGVDSSKRTVILFLEGGREKRYYSNCVTHNELLMQVVDRNHLSIMVVV